MYQADSGIKGLEKHLSFNDINAEMSLVAPPQKQISARQAPLPCKGSPTAFNQSIFLGIREGQLNGSDFRAEDPKFKSIEQEDHSPHPDACSRNQLRHINTFGDDSKSNTRGKDSKPSLPVPEEDIPEYRNNVLNMFDSIV